MECDYLDEEFILCPGKYPSNDELVQVIEELAAVKVPKMIVFEDMLSMFTSKDISKIVRLLSVHRHSQTSYILVSQTYKSLPGPVRSCEISDQCTLYIAKQNRSELIKDIYEEHSVFDSLSDFQHVNSSLEPYNFIKIDKERYSTMKPFRRKFFISR
jgi:hypothetical protein